MNLLTEEPFLLVYFLSCSVAHSSMQGPIQRLAATVEQARTEQALYLQRARDSEAAGEWNVEVSAS